LTERSQTSHTNKFGSSVFSWNYGTKQHKEKEDMATLFTIKIMSVIKRKMSLRISDWARFKTSDIPTGELSSKRLKKCSASQEK
jgi:hypothetical protein